MGTEVRRMAVALRVVRDDEGSAPAGSCSVAPGGCDQVGWIEVVDVTTEDRDWACGTHAVEAVECFGAGVRLGRALSQGERTPDRQGRDAETVSASVLPGLPAGRPAERQPEWVPTGASRDLIHLGSSEVVGPWGHER